MRKKPSNGMIFIATLILGFGCVVVVRHFRGLGAPPPDLIGQRTAGLKNLGTLHRMELKGGSTEEDPGVDEVDPKPLPPEVQHSATPRRQESGPRLNVAQVLSGIQKASIEEEAEVTTGSKAFFEPVSDHLNVPRGVYDAARVATENLIKVKDESLGYNGRLYAATLSAAGVELSLPFTVDRVGQPRLALTLADVRIGGQTVVDIAARVTPELLGEERTIRYDRGAVQEDYSLRPDAMEQSFRFTTLPPGRGAISITTTVETNLQPPPDGTTDRTLAFGGDRKLLFMTHAIVLDSAGRSLELNLSYAAGKVTVTVPAEWVAEATLPIVLDPLIGAPVTVDGSVNGSFQLVDHFSDVVYNSKRNEWFVVWSEPHGAATFDDDIFGQRISSTGALLGGPIAIDTRTSGAYEMSVSYAVGPDRYLVSWRTDPSNNDNPYDGRIDGRVMKANGTAATGIFNIGNFAELDMYPASASDGTHFYVTWQHIPSSGIDRNIYGRFVTNGGARGAFAHPDTDVEASQNPRVAYNAAGNSYMIIWRKSPGGNFSLYGRLLSASNSAFLTAPFAIEGPTGVTCPDVSAGNSRFLIVWTNAFTRGVFGRLNYSATGMALNYPSFAIRTGSNEAVFPKAAFSTTSNRWYVAYTDAVVPNELAGSKVTYDGALDGQERLTYNSVAESCSSIAWNSVTNEMMVVFRQGNGPYTIQAQRVGFPSAQIFALVSTPDLSELLRYDRGTITRTPLDGSALILGSSANYLTFVIPAPNGWRFEAFDASTGAVVRQLDNQDVSRVRGSHGSTPEKIVVQGNAAYFLANRFGAGVPPVLNRVDLSTGLVNVANLPMNSRGPAGPFDLPNRVGIYYWPDNFNSRSAGYFDPSTGSYSQQFVRTSAALGGSCFLLPSIGVFGTDEPYSGPGRLVQHTDPSLVALGAPVVHQLSTPLRFSIPVVYQNRPAILYGEGDPSSSGFTAIVLYDPLTRTQLLRRPLSFLGGHMKASADFSSVILTDRTTPGIVQFTPGATTEFVRLVNLVNFSYPVVILKAP